MTQILLSSLDEWVPKSSNVEEPHVTQTSKVTMTIHQLIEVNNNNIAPTGKKNALIVVIASKCSKILS